MDKNNANLMQKACFMPRCSLFRKFICKVSDNRGIFAKFASTFMIVYEEKWYYYSILGHIHDSCAK